MVLLSTHNICFSLEIGKLIFIYALFSNSLLIIAQFPKSWILENQILKLVVCMKSVNSFKFQLSIVFR